MKGSLSTFRLTLVSLLLLSGCYKKKEAAKKDTYTGRSDGIELIVRRLSPAETHKQFRRNLLLLGYQPLKITVVNDSDEQLLLRAGAIELPLVPMQELCQETERSVLGILGGPAYLSALLAWPVLVPIVGIGTWLVVRNKQVKAKICEKFFGEDKVVEVLPFESTSRFVFVPIGTPTDRFYLHLFKRREKSYVPFLITLP